MLCPIRYQNSYLSGQSFSSYLYPFLFSGYRFVSKSQIGNLEMPRKVGPASGLFCAFPLPRRSNSNAFQRPREVLFDSRNYDDGRWSTAEDSHHSTNCETSEESNNLPIEQQGHVTEIIHHSGAGHEK